ncbi:hypothetical protein HELRODRAFT_159014 [Helobdella robusta]|uniref:ATP-grasp domain-containing protein n=1 Tax=Helobdella robusta TaxID=6412 RepID=T1ENH5_HELRO|nr:hypothetical protein HELRODRAFT_159014 [Helobdella robusta]ESO12476.1 hypothetical protein HELRODRAFT_159014 [Helobdella robusta]
MLTISELYKHDIADNSIFILEYPSSYPEHFEKSEYIVNKSKYTLDDHYREHDYESNRIEKPHRNLAVMGNKARVYVDQKPSELLVEHWRKKLSNETLRYGQLGEKVTHVCLFPLEVLSSKLHSVNPDAHYHVHSKKFIEEIPCRQADTLSELEFPCVLKVCRSSGGHGTWVLQDRSQFDYWNKNIQETMPNADLTVTKYVENVVANFCCHVYLFKNGQWRWIGVTEKILNHEIWVGAFVEMDKQVAHEKLTHETIKPVLKALHEKSYFGIVGIDVLVDETAKQYVIDINPRIVGSTPLLLSAIELQKKGWSAGMFFTDVKFYNTTLIEIIDNAEAVFAENITSCQKLKKLFMVAINGNQALLDLLLDLKANT